MHNNIEKQKPLYSTVMKKINALILYPSAFKSYSKFERKVGNKLKNMKNVSLFHMNDYNSFIGDACAEKGWRNCAINSIEDIKFHKITHAIVFSDGEEFLDEITKIGSLGCIVSIQRIKITRVVNIRKDAKYNGSNSTNDYEYIGRRSKWGNPHAIGDNGINKSEVLAKYLYDFENDLFINVRKSDFLRLAGKRLGCFCHPHDCHGHIIANYLNSLDDGL